MVKLNAKLLSHLLNSGIAFKSPYKIIMHAIPYRQHADRSILESFMVCH